jgi:RalA-binding protein 1
MLVRYFSGKYSESGVAAVLNSGDSMPSVPTRKAPSRALSRDDIAISKGSAVPISQLTPDNGNAKLFTSPADLPRSSSPSSSTQSPVERPSLSALSDSHARKLFDRSLGQPSSLPDASSPIATAAAASSSSSGGPRANSEMGHYPDLQEYQDGRRFASPERQRIASDNPRKSLHPTAHGLPPPITPERAPSPDKSGSSAGIKISGPLNGAIIPAGHKFGGPLPEASPSTNDRREKAKSRSFWGFGKHAPPSAPPAIPKAVFGVPLDESLDIASIASLPAIVFRAIQYLETKEAEMEEGIYRLSGSSAVIKMLKDRFNMGAWLFTQPGLRSNFACRGRRGPFGFRRLLGSTCDIWVVEKLSSRTSREYTYS